MIWKRLIQMLTGRVDKPNESTGQPAPSIDADRPIQSTEDASVAVDTGEAGNSAEDNNAVNADDEAILTGNSDDDMAKKKRSKQNKYVPAQKVFVSAVEDSTVQEAAESAIVTEAVAMAVESEPAAERVEAEAPAEVAGTVEPMAEAEAVAMAVESEPAAERVEAEAPTEVAGTVEPMAEAEVVAEAVESEPAAEDVGSWLSGEIADLAPERLEAGVLALDKAADASQQDEETLSLRVRALELLDVWAAKLPEPTPALSGFLIKQWQEAAFVCGRLAAAVREQDELQGIRYLTQGIQYIELSQALLPQRALKFDRLLSKLLGESAFAYERLAFPLKGQDDAQAAAFWQQSAQSLQELFARFPEQPVWINKLRDRVNRELGGQAV